MKRERRKEDGRVRGMLAALSVLAVLSLAACAGGEMRNAETPAPERVNTGFIVTGPDSYDSADMAILVGRNAKEGTVTFLNLDLGRRYTLSVDGTTRLYDRYGSAVSMEQIELGDVVDITFLKSKKHLTTMRLSTAAWIYTNVERYEINTVRGDVSIGSETYKLTSNTQYLSEGRSIELMDLNPSDVLSFQGIDNQILAVRVDKGHGYLRLANDEHFLGGWIEIGQTLIRQITEDMLILVPEGSYEVNITNRGGGGRKDVVIRRNEEVTLDIGDLEVPAPQAGIVLFSLNPAGTELYVDGSKVDASLPISLEYGLHQLIARADGYQSITRYIRVAEESAGINLILEPVGAAGSTNPPSSSAGADTAITDYYKVYVDAPEKAEVYVDGNYVGIAPCSFKKEEGVHVVTLRRTGYNTRSYTVQIDGEEKDTSWSFADLVYDISGSSNTSGSANTAGTPNP